MRMSLKDDIDVERIESGDVIVFVSGDLCLVALDDDERFCLIDLNDLYIKGQFNWGEFLKFINENEIKRIIKSNTLELKEVY